MFICLLYTLAHIKPEYQTDCRGVAKKLFLKPFLESFTGLPTHCLPFDGDLPYLFKDFWESEETKLLKNDHYNFTILPDILPIFHLK